MQSKPRRKMGTERHESSSIFFNSCVLFSISFFLALLPRKECNILCPTYKFSLPCGSHEHIKALSLFLLLRSSPPNFILIILWRDMGQSLKKLAPGTYGSGLLSRVFFFFLFCDCTLHLSWEFLRKILYYRCW